MKILTAIWLSLFFAIGLTIYVVAWALGLVIVPILAALRSYPKWWHEILKDMRYLKKFITYTYTLKLTGRNRWKEDEEDIRRRYYGEHY